jgi:predicted RNA-binding protein with RPS1 domain
MAVHGPGEGRPDPGTRLILGELRDLRLEMRADRRRSDEERKRSDEERRRADERFERLMRDFQRDSGRREAATQRAFKDIRTVGLSIVKT